jgi:uncharacterized protein YbbK (DUF523 family)
METIIVSACLLGENTKYDGGNNYDPAIERVKEKYNIVPVCPEVFGGLKVPRAPIELHEGFPYGKNGKDYNGAFLRGSKKVETVVNYLHIKKAIFMDCSPSCGVDFIYDGSFSKRLIAGEGYTTARLRKMGLEVLTLSEFVAKYIEDGEES